MSLCFVVALALAGCASDDGGADDFCSCTDRVPSTMFGFGESCYDGCNWTECATGNQTSRACVDAGPLADGGTCMPPDEVEISCEPLPAGTTEAGCSGLAFGAPVPGGDETTVWPIGCVVEYPQCLDAFPSQVARCECAEFTAPIWNCPE